MKKWFGVGKLPVRMPSLADRFLSSDTSSSIEPEGHYLGVQPLTAKESGPFQPALLG